MKAWGSGVYVIAATIRVISTQSEEGVKKLEDKQKTSRKDTKPKNKLKVKS